MLTIKKESVCVVGCSDVADKYKYGVVRHFVGHGVGKIFHSGPSVLHFRKSLSKLLVCFWLITV